MADLLPRGLRASPSLLDQAVVAQPAAIDPAGGMSQVERGLRSSLSGQSAGALAAEGLQAEIGGNAALAAEKYRQADIQRTNAAATAPRVGSLKDVHGVDDFGDYLAGGIPQVVTSTAPALAGALAGRGLGGRLGMAVGGIVPAYNMEANETMGELAQDPAARARMTPEQIQNLGRLKGGINAAMEVAGPAYLIERAIGKQAAQQGIRGAAKTVLTSGAVEGPLTELPQELVGQAAQSYARTGSPTEQIDPWALADATVQGAAGGHAMALPAAGAQLAHGAMLNAGDAAKAGAGKVTDFASDMVDGGIDLAGNTPALFDRLKGSASDFAARKLEDLAGRTPPAEIAQDPTAAAQWVQQRDAEVKAGVDEHINSVLSDPDAPDWKKSRMAQMRDQLAQAGDPYAYTTALQGFQAVEKVGQTSDRLKEFASKAVDFAKGLKDGPTVKKNEQLTASQQLAIGVLEEHTSPDVAQSDGFRTAAPFIVNALTTDSYHPAIRRQAVRELMELYGDKAPDIAAKIGAIANRDNPKVTPERVVQDFNTMLNDDIVHRKNSRGAVADNLSNEGILALEQQLGTKLGDHHYDRLAEIMQDHAAGKAAPKEAQALFGDKFKRVENFFRAAHDVKSQNEAVSVSNEDGEFEADQAEKNVGEDSYVQSKGKTLLMDKAYPQAIQERIATEQAKNPHLLYEAVPAKDAGLDSDKMVLKATPRTDDEATTVNRRDLEKMAGDKEVTRSARRTKPEEGWRMHGEQMSRVGRAEDGVVHFETTDGKTLAVPAYKLAYNMRGRLQKSGTENTLPHNAFSAALSSVLTHADVKRAYVIGKDGKELDLGTKGALKDLRIGSKSMVEHWKASKEEASRKQKRYEGAQLRSAKEKLAEEVAPGVKTQDAIEAKLADVLNKARESKNATKIREAAADLSSFKKNPAKWLAEREAMRDMVEREWTRAADNVVHDDGSVTSDTDPFLKSDATAYQERLDHEAAQLEIETKRQERRAKKEVAPPSAEAEDKLAKMQAAVKNNDQAAEGPMSFKGRAEAIEYIQKTLGKNIELQFKKDLGGASGEWQEGDTVNAIRLALNAGPGVLSVAHHESLHELISRLTKSGRADVRETLLTAANAPVVKRQLARLLRNEPAALAAMKGDPEEVLAYAYQFWAAGQLHIGPKTENIFQRIAKFLRKATGMLANDERAEAILQAFYDGKMAEPSAAASVLTELMHTGDEFKGLTGKLAPLYKKAYNFVMPSHDVLTSSDNTYANTIAEKFFTQAVGDKSGTHGYLNAVRAKGAEWTNRFADTISDLEPEELEVVREALSTGKPSKFVPAERAARKIRALLDEFYDYAVAGGLNIAKREDYFPRVWDFEKINENKEAFVEMLTKNYPDRVTPELAKQITASMAVLSGVEQHGNPADETYTPYMQAANRMKLDFVKDEHAQEFLNDDLIEIMTSYIKQGVRRVEYEARMGKGGEKLENLITDATYLEVEKQLSQNEELAAKYAKLRAEQEGSPEETRRAAIDALRAENDESFKKAEAEGRKQGARFSDAVQAMEGTIGHDKITDGWRKFNSWMLTYQNLRLLPLTLFSNMIDPLGFIVRGGSIDDALDAYKRGLTEVINTWRGKDSRDSATKLAEQLGVIEHQSFLDTLGYVHESMFMSKTPKKISDAFFKWNGMEAWNRAMRTQATMAAIDFIGANAADPGEHSDRWLEELGLKTTDVVLTNGKPALSKEDFEAAGKSKDEARVLADKMQFAVNQWVDGAMLRPNAATRPSWSSDPRWSLLFHLKQFTYAFQKTFLARVKNEFKHGNSAPAVAMMPFVPMMIATDVSRGLIQNAGELPSYMKGWGAGDYLMHGIQRAGLTGISQFGADELTNPLDFAGPAVGQAVDVFTQPAGETLREAVPGLAAAKFMAD